MNFNYGDIKFNSNGQLSYCGWTFDITRQNLLDMRAYGLDPIRFISDMIQKKILDRNLKIDKVLNSIIA